MSFGNCCHKTAITISINIAINNTFAENEINPFK